jgi:alpha-tubulin suppressor-like RCC1 family protein
MHTCGLTEAGAAHCWKAYPDSMPAPVGGGLTFISLSAGDHHVCGITDAGTGYCWGSNHAGQLGDGTTEASPTPVAVVGELEFATISAGANHTCALTTAGEAYCWGDNGHYQLGTGGDSPHPPREPVPVAVKGGLRFREIQASGTGVWLYGSFTCGVTTGFETYCWGSNMAGQMGNRLHASVIPLEGALGLQPLPAGIFPAGTFPVPD